MLMTNVYTSNRKDLRVIWLQVRFKCCRFLVNPTKDIDLRKWAAEGLAYLTLDADVKEDLVADTPALRSLMDLAKVMCRYIFFIILAQVAEMNKATEIALLHYWDNA